MILGRFAPVFVDVGKIAFQGQTVKLPGSFLELEGSMKYVKKNIPDFVEIGKDQNPRHGKENPRHFW